MSDIQYKLLETRDRNHELLTVLAQTDYAPPALKRTIEYITDLKSQLSSTEAQLKGLRAITRDERKDHLSYRDSTVRRFAHRLGGSKSKEKFASKQEKEEREFLEAWQNEREAEDRKLELERALSQAETDKTNLDPVAQRQQQAQSELDALYNSIFGGPTPEVPGEDQLEEAVRYARINADNCRLRLNAERHALEELKAADRSLRWATAEMGNAQSASTWDVMGGGTWADMEERNSLSVAERKIADGRRHIEEARKANPELGQLNSVQLPTGHIMSDVIFDNIFTDMAQHDRILDSARDLDQAVKQLDDMIKMQISRLRDTTNQITGATSELETARRSLQDFRAEAFMRIAGSDGYVPQIPGRGEEALPAYNAYA